MCTVSPLAHVSPLALVERNARIGHWCELEDDTVIGNQTTVHSHSIIRNHTFIGETNTIHSFCVLGGDAQILNSRSEFTGSLHISNGNKIREHVTIHKGSKLGEGKTQVGSNNLIMTGCHIGHDCIIGNDCVISASSTLAGHVTLNNSVRVGGNTSIAQWVRVGSFAFIGGNSGIDRDIPPFSIAVGDRPDQLRGPNIKLLKELFDRNTVYFIENMVRSWMCKRKTYSEAIYFLKNNFSNHWAGNMFISFVCGSKKGVLR